MIKRQFIRKTMGLDIKNFENSPSTKKNGTQNAVPFRYILQSDLPGNAR